jgi:hypothetical protein
MRCSSITNDNKPQKFVFVIIINRLNQRSFLLFIKIVRSTVVVVVVYLVYTQMIKKKCFTMYMSMK